MKQRFAIEEATIRDWWTNDSRFTIDVERFDLHASCLKLLKDEVKFGRIMEKMAIFSTFYLILNKS